MLIDAGTYEGYYYHFSLGVFSTIVFRSGYYVQYLGLCDEFSS
jgi:hypothetical protein